MPHMLPDTLLAEKVPKDNRDFPHYTCCLYGCEAHKVVPKTILRIRPFVSAHYYMPGPWK